MSVLDRQGDTSDDFPKKLAGRPLWQGKNESEDQKQGTGHRGVGQAQQGSPSRGHTGSIAEKPVPRQG